MFFTGLFLLDAMKKNTFLLLLLISIFFSADVFAKLSVPSFVSDGMVLQRNTLVPIWGWGEPGEKVELLFRGDVYHTVTGVDKKWKLALKSYTAGGPYTMRITGSNQINIQNILLGDVWLCSGQSNMEFEMFKAKEKYANEIAASSNDMIRQFLVKRSIAFLPSLDIETEKGWLSASPENVLNFSAVAYFFGKQLFDKYHVPIGLINCSYGGTPAEAWMNENDLHAFPVYYDKAMLYKDTALVSKTMLADKQLADNWYAVINKADIGTKEKWYTDAYPFTDWKTMSMPNYWEDQGVKDANAGVVWLKKEINIPAALINKDATLYLGNISMRDITYVNGNKVGTTSNKYAPRKYMVSSKYLKEGKNVITIRVVNEAGSAGFIKDKSYQIEIGDANISLVGDWQYKIGTIAQPLLRDAVTRFQDQGSAMYYGMLHPLVGYGIKGVIWYQGESNISKAKEYQTLFPALIKSWRKEWEQGDFPFLFVQLANHNETKSMPAESKLAELQEAQTLTLSLPNTGMAVANDIGEWNDVHPQNKSTVGYRLFLQAQKIAYGEKAVIADGPLFQSCKIEKDKCILSFTGMGSGLESKGGGALKYFSISGDGKKFVWAKAWIEGDKVIVSSDQVLNPKAVRYAWADNPEGANLFNKEGLPASCFRTDLIKP